jgi:asparaginyl-tRNA synthetase
MSYTEAVDVLRAKSSSLTATPPKWGEDLRTEHEQFLVDFVGNQPLFVTNYPKTLKPFYARTIDGSPQLVCLSTIFLFVFIYLF